MVLVAAAPHTVAGRTTVAKTKNPAAGREHQWRLRPPKVTPLPRLMQRPRPPRPPPHLTPCPIRPVKPTIKQNQAGGTAEEDDASSNERTSTVDDVLRLMDALCLPVGADLYALLLSECTEPGNAAHGAEVHAHLQRSSGSLLRGPGGTLLVDRLMLMYAASGRVREAREVLDGMPTRGATSWATMIAAVSEGGNHKEALRLFAEMMHEQGLVDVGSAGFLSIAAALRSSAVAGCRNHAFGKCIHGLILKIGGNARMGCSLVHFYGVLGQVDGAWKVFNSTKNICGSSVWNAMVVTCCRLGMVGKAFELFGEMRKTRRRLKSSLLCSMLKACGRREEELPGRQVHACAVKVGVEGDFIVLGSLVEMYGGCGLVFDARRALEMMIGEDHKKVAWNAVLGIITENESSMHAIRSLYE